MVMMAAGPYTPRGGTPPCGSVIGSVAGMRHPVRLLHQRGIGAGSHAKS
jgi:hypothetical protein